jgi:hypothetical protein
MIASYIRAIYCSVIVLVFSIGCFITQTVDNVFLNITRANNKLTAYALQNKWGIITNKCTLQKPHSAIKIH